MQNWIVLSTTNYFMKIDLPLNNLQNPPTKKKELFEITE